MPFLKLNGMTIPTARGGSMEYIEAATRERSGSGASIVDVRFSKRRWVFSTPPISELRSIAVTGMLEGLGHFWPSTSSSTTPTSGRTPDQAVVTTKSYYAADGIISRDENGVAEAPVAGGYSFQHEPSGATNLLSSAIATATSTAGITATDCVLSIDTDNKWQGTSSLRMQMAGNATALYTTFYTGALNTRYIVSCYIKVDASSVSTAITLSDTANGISASSPTVSMVTANGWRRFTTSITTPAAGSTPTLRLLINAAAGGLGSEGAMFVDGVQLEVNSYGAFPTSFVAPGAPRAVGDFYLSGEEFTGPSGMTVSFWQTIPNPIPASFAMHIQCGGPTRSDGTQQYFRLGITGATVSTENFTTSGSTTSATGLVYTGWHMVTAVLRINPETGEASKALYFDGVLKASSTQTIAAGLPTSITSIYLGGLQGTPGFNKFADIRILPYAVDAASVSTWYTEGASSPNLLAAPLLTASGEFIAESSVLVVGHINRMNTVGYFDNAAGVWRSNGRVVEFVLEET